MADGGGRFGLFRLAVGQRPAGGRFRMTLERLRGAAAVMALMIARDVEGDLEKPGGKPRFAPEAGTVPVDPHEGFLSEVAGVFIVTGEADEVGLQRALPTAHQAIEGGVFPGLEGGDIRRVGDGVTHCRPKGCVWSCWTSLGSTKAR